MLKCPRDRNGPGGRNRHGDGEGRDAAADGCADATASVRRRRRMKIYEGGRSLDGAVVTVDGAKLDPRFDIHRFSRMGFEWTYEGDGPRQLALALLADHLGDPARALALSEAFMRAVVAELDNAWRLTSAEIDEALSGF